MTSYENYNCDYKNIFSPTFKNKGMKIYDSSYVFSSTINAALGSCFFGYINSVFNPLQAYIKETVYDNQISDNIIYLMTSLVPAGGALGAITSTSLAFKYGRRNAMFITDAISIIAVLMTLMQDQYLLLIGRLISGFCIGLNSSLVPLYISEISPVQAKGMTGTFTQIAVSVGILLSYLFGLNVEIGSTSEWWRFMLGFPALLAIGRSALLIFKFNHDTPKYLMLKGNEGEAEKVLERIYHRQARSEQLVLLRKEKQSETEAGKVTYQDLFTYRYSTRLKIGCFIAMLQQFSGINAIIYYSTTIFSENEPEGSNLPQIYTMVVGVLNLISALLATCLIGRMGRRQLLLLGTAILFLSLIMLPISSVILPSVTFLSKLFIFCFILGFGFSLGSVTWIYISEILPDLGVGVAVLSSWVAGFVVAQVFPYLSKYAGQNGAFLVFAAFCLGGLVLIKRWVKETKGKMPHEIASMFLKTSRGSTEMNSLSMKPDSDEGLE